MIIVYIHCIVWEEIGDVLHGLGGDRGWTPKSDFIWEEIGDGLHWYSKFLYHLWSMKCFNMSCYLMRIVKYGSVLLWVIISFKLLILEKFLTWAVVSWELFGQVLSHVYKSKLLSKGKWNEAWTWLRTWPNNSHETTTHVKNLSNINNSNELKFITNTSILHNSHEITTHIKTLHTS